MIIVDMDMQDNCQTCPFRERSNIGVKNYCKASGGRRIEIRNISESKPLWCPIKGEIGVDILGTFNNELKASVSIRKGENKNG